MPIKPDYQKQDYRPAPDTKGPHIKPIYNAADYRPGWGGETIKAKGGKGKKAKKARIFGFSRRLAPGVHDPWKGVGR